MKTLANLILITALALGGAQTASAQEDPVLKSQMDSLQKWGAACMQATGAQIQAVCEKSLDDTLALQPEIQRVDQLMMSFMVEAHARSNLANYYIKREMVQKHCDQSEKVLITGLYASKYKDHDFFPPIKQIANSHVADVKLCRKLFGAPAQGVKL